MYGKFETKYVNFWHARLKKKPNSTCSCFEAINMNMIIIVRENECS